MPPPRLIPLSEFFDNPERALAKPSPDGTMLSWVAPLDGRLNVWVRPLEGGDAVAVTRDTDRGVMGYSWTRDSTRILYSKDQGGDENHHVMCVDVPGDGTARDLTPFDGVRASIVAVPRATPGQIIMSTNRRDRSMFDAARLDLATGELVTVAANPGNVIGWFADHDGLVRGAYAQTPDGDYEVLVRDGEDGEFRLLAAFANEDAGTPFGFNGDSSVVWVGSARGSDRSRLVAIDVATGEETVLDEDAVADLGAPIVSDKDRTLLGAAYLRDRLVVHTFDTRFAADFAMVRAIADGDPRIIGSDSDERMWTVAFDSDVEPGATYLVNRETRTHEFLFHPRPWLLPEDLAPMRPVSITSRDRLTLHSYLTVPTGCEERNLPMVLVVHGGPWSRDAWGYDAEAQFLANRGYAVLQVNYRGSTGFGKHFMHAAEHEFAGKMHDDLIDAVDWAVGEGIADPDRLAIYGASYGGYATLVGVTFTPDVFRAAISYVGPSSLVTLIESFPDYWRPFLASTWYRFVGDPEVEADREDMWMRSPLRKVDDIVTPLMVIQGANDPRVTQPESDQIVAALRARGVAVEYIVADDEGHGFVKPENRMRAYRAIETFLAEHLGGRTA
ncbi:MAG: S9 family peptidase [Thermoleophilia bacterium]|nr:S9 family peptidase [Thermoleophilia bacterium]